jgi:myo-inositol 2-dehydrogenase/D-chiro-inositol 1-dehydrogenase
MSKKLKVAVIGAGRIGQLHAEHLAYRIPEAQLVAIADVNLAAAQQLAQRLAVGQTTADYKQLLSSDIDAVVICSSTDTHA